MEKLIISGNVDHLMAYWAIFRVFLRYTLGVGPAFGGLIALAVSFWTNVPRELLAMGLMAPGVFIAPFLFTSDTSLSTIDESAEAGFLLNDPSQHEFVELSFPGRLQLGFFMFGLFLAGALVLLMPQ